MSSAFTYTLCTRYSDGIKTEKVTSLPFYSCAVPLQQGLNMTSLDDLRPVQLRSFRKTFIENARKIVHHNDPLWNLVTVWAVLGQCQSS